MFTGIIESLGTIRQAAMQKGDLRVEILAPDILDDVAIGDSIACNGCCLTVVAFDTEGFVVELSQESLAKTAPRWRVGDSINLERAMKASARFGGHVVSGHVEARARVRSIDSQPGAHVIVVDAPEELAPFLLPKGSITVDGISLTLVDVGGPAGSRSDWPAQRFSLWIVPHTLAVTTLAGLQVGDEVNIETDLFARYLQRMYALGALSPQTTQTHETEV